MSAVITINFSLDGVNIQFMEGLTLESVRFSEILFTDIYISLY